MRTVITPIQMRFNDIDGFGHVNNSVYNEYLDCGRVDYLNQIPGIDFLSGTERLVVVHIETDFFRPSYLGEDLAVHTQIDKIGEKSVAMIQLIVGVKNEVKLKSRSVMSTFNINETTSFVLPENWVFALEKFTASVLDM
ncbi:MAG: acyl-CoA thioesterase [Prevotellaceae bacterium]|jgi:acyl-CoA thioester hydrolase|nr:acyl-CoA thioesterase [Prevotellaceae bacterium]